MLSDHACSIEMINLRAPMSKVRLLLMEDILCDVIAAEPNV